MDWEGLYINCLLAGILLLISVVYFIRKRKQGIAYRRFFKNRLEQDNQLVEKIRHADWLTKSFSEVEIAGKRCFYHESSHEKEVLFLKAVNKKYRIGKLIRWASPWGEFDHIPIEFPDENISFGVETGFLYTEIPSDRVEKWEEEYQAMIAFLATHHTSELGIDTPISLEEYMTLLDSKKSLLEY